MLIAHGSIQMQSSAIYFTQAYAKAIGSTKLQKPRSASTAVYMPKGKNSGTLFYRWLVK